ncbi:MAG: cell division protein FtsL [Deltaproteobacteria bacterium]|nr:cell division protein FtsL [Deltaproteobacteria bacterium]
MNTSTSLRSSRGSVLFQLLPPLLAVTLFVGVGLMHVTSRVLVVGVGYELSRLEQENHDLLRQNDALRVELAALKNPARLERVAREQLGMVSPPAGAVITLPSSTARSAERPAAPSRAQPTLTAAREARP